MILRDKPASAKIKTANKTKIKIDDIIMCIFQCKHPCEQDDILQSFCPVNVNNQPATVQNAN